MRNSNDNRNLFTPDRILFELHNLEFVTVTWSDKVEQDSDDQIDNLCTGRIKYWDSDGPPTPNHSK